MDFSTDLSISQLRMQYDPVVHTQKSIEVSHSRFAKGLARGDPGGWGVGALVVHNSRALFVREGEIWLLPGGNLQEEEPLITGAKREVHEETGLEISSTDVIAIAEQTFVDEETHSSYRYTFVTVLGEPVSDPRDIAPQEINIDEVAWFDSVPTNTFDRSLVETLVNHHC